MKIPSRSELQQIAIIHSSDIKFKDFMKPYKKYTAEPCLFLGIDTTLLSNNALGFWKNLLEEV